MNVRFIDIIMIFNIEPRDCDEWPAPGMTLKEDGIWIIPPSEIKKEIINVLTKEEFCALIEHPTGHYTKPALPIPCDRDDLVDFLVDNDFFDFGVITKIKKEYGKTYNKKNSNKKASKEEYMENYKESIKNIRKLTQIELKKQINDYFLSRGGQDKDENISTAQYHETLILKAIKDLGHDPLKIPQENGKRGIKHETWNKLSNIISSKETFNYRWKNMRIKGKIKNA